MPPSERIVNVRNIATGAAHGMPESEASALIRAQPATWEIETPADTAAATVAARRASDYDTLGDKAVGSIEALARGASVNLSDVGLRALGVPADDLRNRREAIGGWATPLEIGGAVIPALATGGASAAGSGAAVAGRGGLRAALGALPSAQAARLSTGITRAIAPEGAGLGAKLLGGFAGAGAEGAIYGAGQVATEAALSDDPLSLDHLKGAVTSNFLLSGALGAGASALEHGLAAGSRNLDRLKREAEAAPTVADDLATLDRKGLETVKAAEDASIEAARVPQRAQLAADVSDLVATLKADQPWLAVAQGATLEQKRAAIAAVKPLKAAMKKAESRAAELEANALAAESAASHPVVEGAADVAAPAPRQTWKEFQASRMGEYMKSEGGHGPAMKRIGEEWKAYKVAEPAAGATSATAARVTAEQAAEARAAATAAREAADNATATAAAAEARANVLRQKAVPWMSEAASVSNQSDRVLRNLLDDPKALAGTKGHDVFVTKAKSVATALRKEETHYENILAHESELKALYAHDTSTARADAFATIPKALEKNRALQQRIDALLAAPSSPRLGAINDAITSYADRAKLTTTQKIGAAVAGGTTMSAVYAVGSMLPGVGFLAPLAGAAAGGLAINKLGKVMGKTSAASLERSKRAVDALMSGVRSAKRVIPPLASKVLAAFADDGSSPAPRKAAPTLQDHYARAAAKIAPLVAPGPDGMPKVRPDVRVGMAKRIAPIAAHDPRAADALETHAVRRIEFLAHKMPKVRQIGGTRMMPSDGVIRAWARMVTAADNPGEIEERVAHGTVTLEDREVMQALYPERYAAFVRQVIEHPEATAKLPYQSRLALSIFTGAPIDASMEPRILAYRQASFKREPNTEGGTTAPKPQPAFGSVTAPEGTPAQRRAG